MRLLFLALCLVVASITAAEPESETPGDRVMLPYDLWDRSGNDQDPPVAMSSTRIEWGDELPEVKSDYWQEFWDWFWRMTEPKDAH